MKKTILAVAAIVALVLVAALAVPALIDWSRYKAEIAGRLQQATGRDVTIAGDVGLRLLPAPAFRANDIRIGDLPGSGDQPFATASRLDIRLRLLPLLTGKAVVDSLVLDKPVVNLRRLPDGRANWHFARNPDDTPAAAAPSEPAATAPKPRQDDTFSIKMLDVRDGTLSYQAGPDRPLVAQAVNARIEAGGGTGPYRAQGSLRLRGIPVSFEGAIDRLAEQRGSPARMILSIPGLEARAEFSGMLSSLSGGETLVGRLLLSAADLARALPALPANTPLNVEAALSANAQEVALKDLIATLGDIRATGGISAGFGDRTTIDARLAVASLDLDKWRSRGKPEAAAAAQPSATPAPQGPATAPAAPQMGFTLPADIFATAELAVETLAWRGQVVRQARVEAVLDQGELNLQGATALLPGGSVVSLAGILTTPQGKPSFDGQAEARSDNLRAVLDWLGIEAGSVPRDRLRQMEFSTSLNADTAELRLRDLRLKLDGNTARGSVDARLGGRPAYGVALAVDHLNIDAYRGGDAPPPQATTAPEAGPPQPSAPAQPAAGRRELAAFDADLRLNAKRLTAFGRSAEDVSVNAALTAASLVVRDGSARMEGLPLRFGGTVSGQGDGYAIDGRGDVGGLSLTAQGMMQAPRYDVAIQARHDSFAQAMRLVAPGYRPTGTVGALSASAKVAGGPQKVEVSALDLRAGAARLTGQAAITLGGKPAITAELAANAIDLDPFMPAERTGWLQPGGPRLPPALPLQPPSIVPVAVTGGATPWSAEPLDLSALRAVNARLNLRAEGLHRQGWQLDDAKAELAVTDGIATIERLTGRLLGGELTAQARLDATGTPQLSAAATIAGANLSQARLGAGDMRVTQGRLDADAKFATSGRSSQDMAARLQGNGKLAVTDGILGGFDLAAVNQRINNIENIGSLLGLAQAGMGGGSTRFSKLAGTFTAENGIITSRDMKLEAQGGSATAETIIRLPPWTIQSAIAIALADAKAPPLVIRLDGPMGNPRKVVDINAIQQYLVTRGLGRAFKGSDTAGDPAAKTPNGPTILRELLKGFGGR